MTASCHVCRVLFADKERAGLKTTAALIMEKLSSAVGSRIVKIVKTETGRKIPLVSKEPYVLLVHTFVNLPLHTFITCIYVNIIFISSGVIDKFLDKTRTAGRLKSHDSDRKDEVRSMFAYHLGLIRISSKTNGLTSLSANWLILRN